MIQLQEYHKTLLTLVIGMKTNLVITNPCVSYINTLVQYLGDTRALVEEQLHLHASPTHLHISAIFGLRNKFFRDTRALVATADACCSSDLS